MLAEARLLRLIDALCRELGPGRPPARLDSHLERALGLDSLARAELLLRCEAEFGLRLPQRLLGEAETPRDFLVAIEEAEGRGGRELEPAAQTHPAAAGAAATTEPAPDDLDTLGEVFAWHARRQPGFAHITYLDDAGRAETVSFERLWREARAVAAGLQAREIAPGDTVALMLPTCPAFFPCFLGILLAGAVPVPIYPPARPSQIEDHLRRHATILANAQARLLIATGEVALPASLLRGRVESLRGTVLADELLAESRELVPVPARADQLALLQYTSGSTGNPKGVMLSHGQLLANIRAMARAARIERDDVFVSWLPLYHDMGLICAWLSSLVHAIPFVVMSPLSFLAAPERWLRAIHDYRGTFSGAPNFAYELCLRRIAPERLADLDLSSWRRRAGQCRHHGPLHRTLCALRAAARGHRPGLWTGRVRGRPGVHEGPRAGGRSHRARELRRPRGRRSSRRGGERCAAHAEICCLRPAPAGLRDPRRRWGRRRAAGAARRPLAVPRSLGDGRLFPQSGGHGRADPR
jgi:acyl carrier protein